MPANVLTAIIDGDVSGLEQATKRGTNDLAALEAAFEDLKKQGVVSLASIEDALSQLKGALKSATNPEDVKKLGHAIEFLSDKQKQLKNASALGHLEGLTRSTQKASTATLGLAKVIDLFPGEIGHLTHTFDSLIESYEQFREKTGSTAGALQGLAGSILGPLGIGIALSAIVPLLEKAGEKLFGFGEHAEDALDKAEKKIKDLIQKSSEISGDSAAGTSGEISRVNALAGIVGNLSKSYDERNRALKELKEINKSYFGDLTLETKSLEVLKDRVNEYTKAIVQQAIIKGFEKQIGDVAVAIAAQSREVSKAEKEVNKFKTALKAKETESPLFTGLAAQAQTDRINKASNAVDGANENLSKQNKLLSELQENFGELNKSISEAVEKSLEFRPLDDKSAKDTESIANKIIDQAKRMAAFLDKNTQFSVKFEVDPNESLSVTLAKAKAFIAKAKSFIEHQTPEFKFKPLLHADFDDHPVRLQIQSRLKNIAEQAGAEATKTFKQAKDAFESEVARLAKANPFLINANLAKPFTRDETLEKGGSVRINPIFDDKDFRERAQTALRSINEKFIQIVGDFQQNIGKALGEGIGDALSGNGFSTLFKGVFNAVGGAMQSLGEALLATAIGLKAIKAAFKTLNPAVALAAGIGLIALGAVIKNSVGNIAGFRAVGGPVQAGKTFVVGEKGPELFTPNISGRIIPNSAISSGSSSSFSAAPIQLTGDFRIHRNDLVLFINQAIAAQNRQI